uniref:U3 small nucleolar RNA-associated protein 6 n=1 Tax=Ascaris suum TaxID=6253 RepID=F1KTA6_ASCSU
MSEFVEESLERLLPVYELLHTVQLLTTEEVNEFIKRCRNYEYRLQKSVKDPNDFMLYADYLRGALRLIRIRRRRLKYFFKHNEIDGAIKGKIADIYRRCSERFQGRADIWRKRLNYLKKENMLARCSKAFFRALQVLGRDVKLRAEAARWEFEKNKSINNARLHLQLGLRSFPESHLLWITFFRIEILNVDRLLKRRRVLMGKDISGNDRAQMNDESGKEASAEHLADESTHSDAVLNLKLAEVVAEQALSCPKIVDKNELLYCLWRTSRDCGEVANRLENTLYAKLWEEGNICEESFIAKHERDIEKGDMYEIYDEAVIRFPTLKMFRHYIGVCERRITLDDVFAGNKLRDLYKQIDELNLATLDDYKKLLEFESDNSRKEQIIQRALRHFPSSDFVWSRLLRLKMDDGNTNGKDVQKLFNDAERAVKSEDMLEIYQLAIDWAISNSPSTVDAIFRRAIMLTPPDVSSEIKCIRLRYLKASNPNDPSVYRNAYSKMCASPPNAMSVHKTFVNLEERLKQPDHKLIVRAMETCVADFGYKDYRCWTDYARYLLQHDPAALASLHERAVVCVPNEQSDAFITEWTQIMQGTSKQLTKRNAIKRKRKKVLEKEKKQVELVA